MVWNIELKAPYQDLLAQLLILQMLILKGFCLLMLFSMA